MEDHTTPRVFINETTIKCQLDIRHSARVLRLPYKRELRRHVPTLIEHTVCRVLQINIPLQSILDIQS